MKTIVKALALTSLFFCTLASAENGYWHSEYTYKVTVTNITKGQSFTPFIAATHSKAVQIFSLGEQASEEIVQIAEGGNVMPLKELLDNSAKVHATETTEGLLAPGQSVEIMIKKSKRGKNRISLAAMLLPTNDTFVALNGIALPWYGSKTVYALAYDAGSETNDEACASIPGPTCGGSPFSPEDDGEGFVHISSGIHGIADLPSAAYDWRDAVAKVEITRVY